MGENVKHTPGPSVIKRKGLIIKEIGPCVPDEYAGSAWLEASEADARLISAAPDLLAVLKRIASAMDFNGTCHPLFDGMQKQMMDAIAKAEGRQ